MAYLRMHKNATYRASQKEHNEHPGISQDNQKPIQPDPDEPYQPTEPDDPDIQPEIIGKASVKRY